MICLTHPLAGKTKDAICNAVEVRVCVEQNLLITHYYHSGFSVASERTLVVFDYWRGENGELKPEKQITTELLKQFDAATGDSLNYVARHENDAAKENAKGKKKRSFVIISLYEAAQAYGKHEPLVPTVSEEGYALIKTIRLGDLVLLYENSPEEIYTASQEELVKRMYEIIGMSDSKGLQIRLKHQQEARPNGELQQINGAFKNGDSAPIRMLLHTQFNALVQGQDFDISYTGKITFKSC